jgi:hypothetical protein
MGVTFADYRCAALRRFEIPDSKFKIQKPFDGRTLLISLTGFIWVMNISLEWIDVG